MKVRRRWWCRFTGHESWETETTVSHDPVRGTTLTVFGETRCLICFPDPDPTRVDLRRKP